MSDEKFDRRFDQMGDVILDATLGSGDNDWALGDWASRRERVRTDSKAYLVWDGSRLVAFTLYSFFPYGRRTCIHTKAGYVRPSHQQGGIGYSISARIFQRALLTRPWGEFLLVSDILNPVVLAGWIERFPNSTKMFPAEFGRPSQELRTLAPRVARDLYPWAEYDGRWSVLKGRTVARELKVPTCGTPHIDDYFRSHMDPTTGDTVLLLVEFSRATIFRSLGRLIGATRRIVDRRFRPRRAPVAAEASGVCQVGP